MPFTYIMAEHMIQTQGSDSFWYFRTHKCPQMDPLYEEFVLLKEGQWRFDGALKNQIGGFPKGGKINWFGIGGNFYFLDLRHLNKFQLVHQLLERPSLSVTAPLRSAKESDKKPPKKFTFHPLCRLEGGDQFCIHARGNAVQALTKKIT